MSKGKQLKRHNKNRPQHKYQGYTNSEITLGSSSWEYSNVPKEKKHVKFEEEYDDSSHNYSLYHVQRQKNVYNYPYAYDSGTTYETEEEINGYDSEDSRYTQYHQPPQHVMYTGTESSFTIRDSDYETNSLNYRPKYKNYNYANKNKKYTSKNLSDTELSPTRKNVSVYFAKIPNNQKKFRYREPQHDESSASDSEVQIRSVIETEGESDYSKHDKRIKSDYQIYAAPSTQKKTNGIFQKELPRKELPKNDKEIVISVTNYDNIPLLALKNKNQNFLQQESNSRVVYLPVLVKGVDDEKTLMSPKISPQSFPQNHVEVAEKPIENLKIYTAVTGQTNIFERSSNKNYDNIQQKNKIESVVESKKIDPNTDRFSQDTVRKSNLQPNTKQSKSKSSLTKLHSILRVQKSKKSKPSLNDALQTNDQNYLSQNEIKKKNSNDSFISKKSTPGPRSSKSNKTPLFGKCSAKKTQSNESLQSMNQLNQKKSANVSVIVEKSTRGSRSSKAETPLLFGKCSTKQTQSNESLNYGPTSKGQDQLNQNEIKNKSAKVSVISVKSVPESRNSKAKKTSLSGRLSTQNDLSEKGAKTNDSYKDKNRRSKTKPTISNASLTSSQSSTSISKISKAHNTISKVHLFITESQTGSDEGSAFYAEAHKREPKAQKDETDRKFTNSGIQEKNKTRPSRDSQKWETLQTPKISKFSKNVTPNEESKIKRSDVKPFDLENTSPNERSQSYESNKQLSNLSLKEKEIKSNSRSLGNANTVKPQHKDTSEVKTSKILSSYISPTVYKDNNKQGPDVNIKSIGKEELKIVDRVKTDIHKESTITSKNNNISKLSGVKNKDNSEISTQGNKENNKLEYQPTDKNKIDVTQRKSIMLKEKKNSQQESVVGNRNNNTTSKQVKSDENQLQYQPIKGNKRSLEEKVAEGYSNVSHGPQESKKSFVKEDNIAEERRKSFGRESTTKRESNLEKNKKEPGSKTSLIKTNVMVKETSFDKTQNAPGARKSSVKENRKFSKPNPEQIQKTQGSKKSLVKEILAYGEANSGQNQTIPSSRESKGNEVKNGQKQSEVDRPVKGLSQAKGNTPSPDIIGVLNKNSEINDDQIKEKIAEDKRKSLEKGTTDTAGDRKSTVRRKSQIFKNESKEKINEEIKKSFLIKDTTGTKEKASTVPQVRSATGEKKSKDNDIHDEQISPTNIGIKANISGVNQGVVGDSRGKEGNKISIQTLNTSLDIKIKNSNTGENKFPERESQQKTTTGMQEKQSTKENNMNKRTSISNSKQRPVSQQKRDLKETKAKVSVQREMSIDKKSKNLDTKKSFQGTLPYETSINGKNTDYEKHTSTKKDDSQVKSIFKNTDKCHKYFSKLSSIQFWGLDMVNIIAYCFRMSRFILGVSPYDKFIEVTWNFQ